MKVLFNTDYAQLNIQGITEADITRLVKAISIYRMYLNSTADEINGTTFLGMKKRLQIRKAVNSLSKLYELLSRVVSYQSYKITQS